MTRYSIATYRDDDRQLTLDELALAAHVHPSLVERFVDLGLVDPVQSAGSCVYFSATAVVRVGAICRLRRDFGANLSSVGLILDLVERIQALEHELERLR